MKPVTYSWIGLSAAAPLIFIICAWVIGVYHSYRRYWRSVDIFLLAVFVQQLLCSLQIFIYALFSLIKPSSGVLCGVFVWSLSSTRILQAATICSLLVDRAMTSQWPYKYRFSVRRHQIRYHLVVLATMAGLVGVAAILARPTDISESFEDCRFLPHSLHIRLSLFLLSLYGVLLVISSVSFCVVQSTRSCKGDSTAISEIQEITPITHGTTGSSTTTVSSCRTPISKPHQLLISTTSTASSTSSGKLILGGASVHSSKTAFPVYPIRFYHKRGKNGAQLRQLQRRHLDDFRWGPCVGVALISFIVNHIPYMCLLVAGTFFPSLLPGWPMENLSLWLSLFEGLLLPLLLGLCDPTFGDAAVLSCSRERSTLDKFAGTGGPFRLGGAGRDEIKSFPLTNGSLFSSLQAVNGADPPFQLFSSGSTKSQMMGHSRLFASQCGVGLHYQPNKLNSPFGHFFYNSPVLGSMASIVETRHPDPIYSNPLTNKSCSISSSSKVTDDEHIYATLSETFGSLSSLNDDSLGDDQRCPSATTVANDDFEYQGVKSSSFEAARKDPLVVTTICNGSQQNHQPLAKAEETRVFLDNSFDSSPVSSYRSSTSSEFSDCLKVPSKETRDFSKRISVSANRKLQPIDCPLRKQSTPTAASENRFVLKQENRSSSLSMNDLDKLNARDEDTKDHETMFILPVKSESMLSLYRFYLSDRTSGDRSLRYSVVSKSESNLIDMLKKERALPKGRDESSGRGVHDIYEKRRVLSSTGSRVRRQHKIQRAKGVHRKSKLDHKIQKNEMDARIERDGVRLAVFDKPGRRNGIITIKDPAVLSVEELFNVLERASSATPIRRLKTHPPHSQPTNEYKKIFVSEYI